MCYFRYIKDQGARKLKRCQEKIEDLQDALNRSTEDIAKLRADEDALAQEVSSANTTLSNLKDNIRLRKINRDIQEVETEKAGLDLEEASRARQQFDERYGPAKAQEEEANRQVSRSLLSNLYLK
jgi:DNA repair protein RAD50